MSRLTWDDLFSQDAGIDFGKIFAIEGQRVLPIGMSAFGDQAPPKVRGIAVPLVFLTRIEAAGRATLEIRIRRLFPDATP